MNNEYSLLGLLIRKPDMLDYCQVLVNFEDPFSQLNLNIIFSNIQKLYNESGKVDKRELMKLGVEKNIQIDIYGELIKHSGFDISINDYVSDVHNMAVKRELQTLAHKLINCTEDDLNTSTEYLKVCRDSLERIDKSNCVSSGVSIGEAIQEVKDKAEMLMKGDDTHYMKTGLLSLDRIIVGLTTKTMSLFAARPSVGKTAVAITVMSNMMSNGIACGFISVEMSEAEIMERLAQVRSNISIYDFGENINEFKRNSFNQHLDSFNGCPLVQIERTTNRRISNIRSIARSMKNRNPELKVIFLDYIQKVQGDDTRQDMRTQVTHVSAVLTDMATDLDVHVSALAQISRDGDDLPKMKNLKESGSLEQDSHYVFLLHRDLNQQHEGNYDSDVVIGVAKNRGGKTGRAQLKYNARTTRFYDEAHEYAGRD